MVETAKLTALKEALKGLGLSAGEVEAMAKGVEKKAVSAEVREKALAVLTTKKDAIAKALAPVVLEVKDFDVQVRGGVVTVSLPSVKRAEGGSGYTITNRPSQEIGLGSRQAAVERYCSAEDLATFKAADTSTGAGRGTQNLIFTKAYRAFQAEKAEQAKVATPA